MVALWAWQALLNALGWILARIYDWIPNYGLAIIVLTVLTRLVLLPLGIKQIKSMQHMQALQPKLKELQKKYKSNKPKLQEEQMRLYRDAGVNPLGGCLPLLLQFPLLFAMYSVIRPIPIAPVPTGQAGAAQVFMIEKNHLPVDSALFQQVITHEGTDFVWMNLQCQLLVAGTQVPQQYKDPSDGQIKSIPAGATIVGEDGKTPLPGNPTTVANIDCGSSRFPDVLPYVLLVVLMVLTTFYTQLQMQRASPPGSQSQQQQTIMRIMPLMFAVFGLQVVSGLVVYWTVSNLFQLGQQTFLLRAGHIGPEAIERRLAEQRQRSASPTPPKEGLMQRLQRRATDTQKTRTDTGEAAAEPKRPSGKQQRPSRGKPQRPSKQMPRGSNAQGKGSGRAKTGKAAGDGSSQKPVPGQTAGETGGDTGSQTGGQTGGAQPRGKTGGRPGRPSIAKPGNQLGKPSGGQPSEPAPAPDPEDEG